MNLNNLTLIYIAFLFLPLNMTISGILLIILLIKSYYDKKTNNYISKKEFQLKEDDNIPLNFSLLKLFFIGSLVQTFFTINPIFHIGGIIGHYIIYFIFFYLLQKNLVDKDKLFFIVESISISSLTLSIIGILSYFKLFQGVKLFYIPLYGGDYLINLDLGNYLNKASSFSMNPNNLGAYLILSIFTIVGIRGNNLKNLDFLSLLLQSICLILTKSRGSILSFLIGLTLLMFSNQSKKIKNILAIMTLLIIGIFLISENYFKLLESIFNFSYSSNALRIRTWEISTEIIYNFPQGVGILNYESIYPSYLSSTEKYIPHAHNWYLHTFIESGILLSLLFFSFYFSSIFKFLKKIKRENYGIVIGIISFSIFNLTDYVLTDTRISMLLTLSFFSSMFFSKSKES